MDRVTARCEWCLERRPMVSWQRCVWFETRVEATSRTLSQLAVGTDKTGSQPGLAAACKNYKVRAGSAAAQATNGVQSSNTRALRLQQASPVRPALASPQLRIQCHSRLLLGPLWRPNSAMGRSRSDVDASAVRTGPLVCEQPADRLSLSEPWPVGYLVPDEKADGMRRHIPRNPVGEGTGQTAKAPERELTSQVTGNSLGRG